jgi:glycosyltransferase involved in cell wall biosynthesis
MEKDIVFLLPATRCPVGGVKVVFEYANRFAADGYTVGMVYSTSFLFKECPIKKKLRSVLRFFYYVLTRNFRAERWFPIDRRVSQRLVWCLSEHFVPKANVYVATAMETSYYLNRYKNVKKKLYFIQDFEAWHWSAEKVIETYHLPLQKIVISKWLKRLIEENGETATFIPNGFCFDYFRKNINYEDRDKLNISMLFHTSPRKGCGDGFKALNMVKSLYSGLRVNLFGVSPRPNFLPEWYHYHRIPNRAEHNRIYNESAIFLATSHAEGWGLPVGEAMICGAAVVCTDIGGYREMCVHGETALMSPVRNPESLAENIIRLIKDDKLRCQIARNGRENIKKFTWEKSYHDFCKVVYPLP